MKCQICGMSNMECQITGNHHSTTDEGGVVPTDINQLFSKTLKESEKFLVFKI